MKKIFTAVFSLALAVGAQAQTGVKFDPAISINFDTVDVIQVPKSPIKTQVLFVGKQDSVTVKGGKALSRDGHDFIGITPDGSDYWISVNHETNNKNTDLGDGGGMSSFKVTRDANTDTFQVVSTVLPDGRSGKYHNVDFANTVGNTWTNCGGIITEGGRIWTAEEYPSSSNSSISGGQSDIRDVVIGFGPNCKDTVMFTNSTTPLKLNHHFNSAVEPLFKGSTLTAAQNQGWMVEIDPKTGKALRKQYNWGRMSFEAGATLNDSVVYLAEDGTPGMFTKFVCDTKGDFTNGKLYVYNEKGGANKWIMMDNTNLNEMISLADSAYKKKATMFVRLEWIIEMDGKIFIAETGKDDAGKDLKTYGLPKGGVVAQHHINRLAAQGYIADSLHKYYDYYGRILVYDPAADTVTSFLEGGPVYANKTSDSTATKGGSYPDIHLSNPDGLGKIIIGSKRYMIINEDLNGQTYNRVPNDYNGTNICDMYLLDMDKPASLSNLVRIMSGPKGAELTGGNGAQDGKTVFIDIQHPSSTNPAPYNKAMTIALNFIDTIADMSKAHFSIDWTKNTQAQYSPKLKAQILFTGAMDSVTVVSGGKAIAKQAHDFIGITPDGANNFWLSINHEEKSKNSLIGDGGGMTSFKITRVADTMQVVETTLADGRKGKFHNVDFVNTVGETWTNCGGIISSTGRIWTAEEYPSNSTPSSFVSNINDITIGSGRLNENLDGTIINKYQNQGWMVEIDPKTGKAVRKQYNWGRMSFEGGAMINDSVVFMAEDGTPGMFTKFVAKSKNDFTDGTLYVYKEDAKGEHGRWIKMDNNMYTMLHLAEKAYEKAATMFVRLEWVVEIDGKIYIAETGKDNAGSDLEKYGLPLGGKVANHHLTRAATAGQTLSTYADYYGRILRYDPATDSVSVYLEGGPAFSSSTSQDSASYPSKHLSNPDGVGKAFIKGKSYLVINEDLNGKTYNRLPAEAQSDNLCDMFLLDVSITNPTVDSLIRIATGPKSAELTGGNGMGTDGKTILVDIQHPSSSNTAPFNKAATVAMTGFDKVSDIKSLHFTPSFSNAAAKAKIQTTPDVNIKTQVIFRGGVDSVTYAVGKNAISRESHDFVGITPDGADYWISVNHETKNKNANLGDGGGMTSFKVTRDAGVDTLIVTSTTLADGRSGKFHNVDFANTVGETWTNCGGIISSTGRIWTAEEYPSASNDNVSSFLSSIEPVMIGKGQLIYDTTFKSTSTPAFKGEVLKKHETQGWMVEIDPKKGEALKKEYKWGRMSFEGAAIINDSIVYMAEDGTPGMFTKFIATKKGDFSKGTLYVYDQNGAGVGKNWIKMDNSRLENMVNLSTKAYKSGATMFVRLEWVVEIDGKIYIAETGLDNAGSTLTTNGLPKGGKVAIHHMNRAAAAGVTLSAYTDYYGRILQYDPATDSVTVYLEGGPVYANSTSQAKADYPSKHLSNPDGIGKIKVNGQNYMILCEDLNGSSYNRLPSDKLGTTCEMYLLDMSKANPTVNDLTRIMVGPLGAELTGGNGTPDGKSILVDVQHPSSSNKAPYNKAITVALTGWDKSIENSVEEIVIKKGEFMVYPNPVIRNLYFNGTYNVALYNMNGVLLRSEENANYLNVDGLTPGIYFIMNDKGQMKKIIIK